MSRRTFPILLVAAALSACVTTHVIPLGTPGRYPPVDPEQVRVFLKEEDVGAKFERIAAIEAEGDYNSVNTEKMIKAMKKKAARLGADALILGEFKDPSTGARIAHAVFGVGGERKGKVIAIRLLP